MIESLIESWPEELGDPRDQHRSASDWVYVDGIDVTRFRSVSLGKTFLRTTSLYRLHLRRMRVALDRMCRRYRPRMITLVDLRSRHGLFRAETKRRLVEHVCHNHGIAFDDRLDEVGPDDPLIAEQPVGVAAPLIERSARRYFRQVYERFVETLFSARTWIGERRSFVYFQLNWAALAPILDAKLPGRCAPLLIAGSLPKGLGRLARAWVRGFNLVALPSAKLDTGDQAALARIREDLERAWCAPDDFDGECLRAFVRDVILDSGWLRLRALEAKRYQALFERHSIRHLVVGDATNPLCRLLLDLARAHNIPGDELLNGMFLSPHRHEARVGTMGELPVLGRLLSRGALDERWLAKTGASCPFVRTGYPAIRSRRPGSLRFDGRGRALVLPFYADSDDSRACGHQIIDLLVETLHVLAERHLKAIRIKLHIGPPNEPYYRRVAEEVGVDAEVVKDNSLAKHIAWADFIVGPINSGAWLEAMAAGKPYFPFCPTPSLIEPTLLPEGTTVLRQAEQLRAHLDSGICPDIGRPLEDIVSAYSIGDPAQAVWRAVEAI
ncbi:MAG: hypothetical protein HZC25_15760 [Rhodospirillales bacterium]|nr:hypothetical protein [Rhodospirillales bacterium]